MMRRASYVCMHARSRVSELLSVFAVVFALTIGRADASQANHVESSVGMPAKIESIVLPGTELEAVPSETKSPIVLRIAATYPHGSEFRYDLEFTGLDPGEYDLKTWLHRKDGSSSENLPSIPVTIRSMLPAGQVKPHTPSAGEHPRLGGYRILWIVCGIIWIAGLAAIVWMGRRRRLEEEALRPRPKSLAEKLEPLVQSALAGKLSRSERAQLELGLVAYWRKRLGYEERRPAETIQLLRDHPEAGPLLTSLEDWLHRPADRARVDVAALLAPYRNLPADALEATR
jgi:hypothetical protein